VICGTGLAPVLSGGQASHGAVISGGQASCGSGPGEELSDYPKGPAKDKEKSCRL